MLLRRQDVPFIERTATDCAGAKYCFIRGKPKPSAEAPILGGSEPLRSGPRLAFESEDGALDIEGEQ